MDSLEKVRIEMYDLIEKYDVKDDRVVEKSQELDKLLNKFNDINWRN